MTTPTQSPPEKPSLEDLRRQSLEDLRRQLPLLCRYLRWWEWEALDILAGLLPTPPDAAAPKTREQLIDEAARREAVRRHVDDLIAVGNLQVDSCGN